ncbi:MAG: hypothetical protein M0Z27_01775 [Thermaerobacter sp.]|jgi:hypothetical protein|nr:hypothetical protein [Thermaerobacter sp.]MDA8144780.1 hypothetical protein [Thermaerobacter sp.]
MGFLDALLGRTRLEKPKLDALFALSTARLTLDGAGFKAGERAGVCLRPVEAGAFAAAEKDLMEILRLSQEELQLTPMTVQDELGFQWVVLTSPQFESLVTAVHLVADNLQEQGFGEQILAAAFLFQDAGQKAVYVVYNYKRGSFYPFVPREGQDQERDNAGELRLSGLLSKELPVEKELERWYALWKLPV